MERILKKILKSINQNYIKAPYFDEVYPMIDSIMNQKEKNLAKFIGFSLEKISKYLEIDTHFIYSSTIEKDNELKAQEKVLAICKKN